MPRFRSYVSREYSPPFSRRQHWHSDMIFALLPFFSCSLTWCHYKTAGLGSPNNKDKDIFHSSRCSLYLSSRGSPIFRIRPIRLVIRGDSSLTLVYMHLITPRVLSNHRADSSVLIGSLRNCISCLCA
ncbi:hypothetical protein BS47DRAFT_36148 [Hydnum rufescens UP504]|uniref:Uncharacterized protein n=1 Tax=Hydnum rufescens UP504 TaxID=1448309 RepID=A0A9P6ASI9_9AGAM|nr:hypothetical protein BS47DRAFT_36148 [Hydnum rufescens UP504]